MPKTEKEKKKTAVSRVEKQVHPKSRKASQLSKIVLKGEKKQMRKEELNSKQKLLKEKVTWFKTNVSMDKEKYTLAEVTDIVSKYLSRFDERLSEIEEQNGLNKSLGRRGRYHAAEEEGIKMVKEREEELFIAGKFEAPDLTNAGIMKHLKNWEGEVTLLQNIKMKNFKRSNNIIPSTINEKEEAKKMEE